jgi:hypothetical protein
VHLSENFFPNERKDNDSLSSYHKLHHIKITGDIFVERRDFLKSAGAAALYVNAPSDLMAYSA